jgi:hypothetical protein
MKVCIPNFDEPLFSPLSFIPRSSWITSAARI